MYATERDNLILVQTKNKKYVFSCRQRETVISKFKEWNNK